MHIPVWLRRYLPMWTHICPKCRREVKQNSHECPHCGEKYPLTLKVPFSGLQDKARLELYVHEHIFPRISAFERNYLTQFFTVLFSDTFASGNFTGGGWSTSGTCSVVSSPVNTQDSYSAKINPSSGNAYIYKTLAASHATLYWRAYVNFANLPSTNGAFETIMFIYDDSWSYEVYLQVNYSTAAGLYFSLNGNTYNVSLSTGIWYCCEISYNEASGTGGTAAFWFNGTQVITTTGLTLTANAQIIGLQVGAGYTAYFDDAIAADAPNGVRVITFSASDAGSGSDSVSVASGSAMTVNDSGLGSDVVQSLTGIAETVLDNGYGSDGDPACPFTLFADNFASGDTSKWSGTQQLDGGTLQVLASAAHSGAYGCEVGTVGGSDTVAETRLSGVAYTAAHSRIYIRFNSLNCIPAGAGQSLDFLEHINGSTFVTITSVALGWNLGAPCIFLQCANGSSWDYIDYAFTPTIGQWYCIELYTLISTTGGAEVWLNGSLILSDWGVNTTQYGIIGQCEFGIPYTNIPAAFTLDYGDCIVSNGYIGPVGVSVAASLPLFDAGSGGDALASLQATVPISDIAQGVDSASINAGANPQLSDASSGTDNLEIQTSIPVSDVGSGVDSAANLQAQIPLTDSGQGSDAVAGLNSQVPLGDVGLGVDSVLIGAPVNLGDLGRSSDGLSVLAQVFLADAGSGLDLLFVSISTLISDVGSGVNELVVSIPISVSDESSGIDVAVVFSARVATHSVVIQAGSGTVTLQGSKGTVMLESDSD